MKINKEIEEKIISNYNNGKKYRETIIELGVCSTTITNVIRKNGIKKVGRGKGEKKPELNKPILRLYCAGKNMKEISKELKVSYGKIKGVLKKNNILRNKINLSEKNGMWKGNDVKYIALHTWVKSRKPKTLFCENCKKEIKRLDLANISGKYKRDINDFKWLCRSCHMKEDGRVNNLMKGIEVLEKGYVKRDKKGRFKTKTTENEWT